jgi:hypothetical protein
MNEQPQIKGVPKDFRLVEIRKPIAGEWVIGSDGRPYRVNRSWNSRLVHLTYKIVPDGEAEYDRAAVTERTAQDWVFRGVGKAYIEEREI